MGDLSQAAVQFEAFKAKLPGIASHGEAAVTNAMKVFGKSVPPMATSQIVMIRQNELNALLTALEGESDIVNYVAGHAAIPNQGGQS